MKVVRSRCLLIIGSRNKANESRKCKPYTSNQSNYLVSSLVFNSRDSGDSSSTDILWSDFSWSPLFNIPGRRENEQLRPLLAVVFSDYSVVIYEVLAGHWQDAVRQVLVLQDVIDIGKFRHTQAPNTHHPVKNKKNALVLSMMMMTIPLQKRTLKLFDAAFPEEETSV